MSVIVLPTTRTVGSPWLLLPTAEPPDELTPKGAVMRPGKELGTAPVRRTIGGKRCRPPFTGDSEDEEGVVAHCQKDSRLSLCQDAVVAEEVGPLRRDAVQDLVLLGHSGIDAL